MAKKFTKILSTLLCVVMLFTSVPMSGIATAVDELSDKTIESTGLDNVSYLSGETTEALRMPVDTGSHIEPEIPGKLVEVNQYSKVYQTSNNTFSSVYSPIPNFYYDEKGIEQEYDNSLKLNDKVGTDEFTNKSSNIDVVLSADLAKKGLTFEHEGVKVGLIPVEGNYDTYLISDNAVRYNNVFEGIDVQYTIDELGIHEYIILNQKVDKYSFSYKLKTNGNKVELVDDVLCVYDGKDTSEPVYTISAPVMTDASGVSSTDIDVTLKGDVLTITADETWLSDVERAYPVYIDPDITINSEIAVRTVVESGDRVYAAANHARGYAGYIDGAYFGFDGVLGRSKMLIHIGNGVFDNIPEGAGIISASFNIYQYVNISSKTNFWCSMVKDSWSLNDFSESNTSKGYTRASKLNTEYLSSSKSTKGWHSFDVRTAVNNWVNDLVGQNGFIITSENNTVSETGGAFVTSTSTSSVAGVGPYADNKPYLLVEWEIPNPVDPNYPLNNTTINLRTIGRSTRDGVLAILGVFADGVAKPGSTVNYVFSDPTAENQTHSVTADISYKYPDTTAWNDNFGAGATKYKDILSNWQTAIPFTQFEFNKVYNWGATASLNGATGNTAMSHNFLIYKVTRFDTLASIAKHYGVSVNQLALDNHVQDMLLVENNTIIVINPTQNANIPYNPGNLTDDEKAKIDGALVGRGKHCEFGFEPINLNTGNFYMNQTDISIPDFNGNFEISRNYNSKSANINSVFGRGWQFDYAESLSKLATGEIVYRRGDGSVIHFEYDNGSYVCPEGYYLELTPIVVDTKYGDFGGEEPEPYDVYEYEIKDANDVVRRFNSSGLLKSVTDAKGFVTTLNYDASYNLSSIVSPAGTTYMITCDTAGRIIRVTVPNGASIEYSYDENGNLVSYTDEVGNVVTYNYDSANRMTSWSDGEGNVIVTNEYDADGRVTKQTDSEGNVTTLEYGADYTKTTDANGNVTKYNYDSNYRTTSVEYNDGSIEYKSYDANNNLSEETDRNGTKTKYEYNEDGFVTKVTRSDGKTQTYSYDADNNITQFTDFDGKSESFTYDAKGNMLSASKKDSSVKTYEYDAKSRLIKMIDENGNATVYEYGDGIWVSKVIDANGNTNEFYYNSHGQVVTSVDALGNTTRYFFDAAGKNLGYQSADDSVVSYTYDKAGCMVTLKNANGFVYTYEYDGIGNITKLIDPLSNEVVYEYDGLYNNISTAYDANHIVEQEYDCFSQVVKVTDEEGNTTTYTYDNVGNKTSEKDSNGNVTEYEYDLIFNKVSKVTDALGNVTTYEYDDIGNLIKTVAANGAVTQLEYDAVGNVVKLVEENGLTTINTYDKVGNLLKSENSLGEITEYTYDDVYNLTSVTYPNGAKLEYTYDALGRKLSEKDSKGATTTYTYDALGRKSSVEDAIGRKTIYTYDANGNLLTETTSNGGVTTYYYDALDRNRQITDALGNSTVMEYDNVGNLISTTNAADEKTAYTYNKTGLVIKTVDPLGGVLEYTYDKNGNLVKAKDALGYEALISYDELNRTVSTEDALGLVTEFEYDSVGNLVTESNNNGLKNTYEYDKSGNLIKSVDSMGNITTYSYDLKGNLLSIITPDSAETTYTYDSLNNLTSMTDALDGKIEYRYDIVGNLISETDLKGGEYTYTYDLVGRMLSAKDPAGQKTQYEYNEFDLVTKVIDANGNDATSEYDIGGNLVVETDQNGNKTKYTYDNVYRLITVAYADGTTNEYSYDANGNITSSVDQNNNATTFEYDALGNILKSIDANGSATLYTYDANGNVLTEENALGAVTTNRYDVSGQLIETILDNGATYTYTYDALGRVTKETLPEDLLTKYVYDSMGNVTEKIDQSDRKTTYTYDLLNRLTTTVDAKGNTTKFTYDKAGNLESLTTPNGNVTKYQYDAVDRLITVTDPMNADETYTYDGVGNVLTYTQNNTRTTSYAYDKVGNMTKITNALGNKKTLAYDSLNRLTSESDFKGKKTTYSYDGNSNIVSVTDRKGNAIKYTYDKLNNLILEMDEEGRNKRYTYDAIGQLTSVTEGNTATSQYEYDSVGNLIYAGGYIYEYNLNGELTSSVDALGNVTEYIYNVNGMLQKVKNADGTSVDYDYNEIDELISKKYDETEDVALYGYDADGNRISMKDIAGTTDYEYDANGRVTAINLFDGKAKVTYTYNEFGEITKLGYPDGTSVSYAYDDLGQLVSITNRDGEKTSYKYDANGNVIEIHRPNKTFTTIRYDENDRVENLKNYVTTRFFFVFRRSTVISEYNYEYDKSGNIVKEAVYDYTSYGEIGFFTRLLMKLRAEHVEFDYDYDIRNQLVSVTETKHKRFNRTVVGETTYTYDASGNRTQENVKGDVTDYKYNEAGQLIEKTTKKETVTYTYDVNGNLIKEQGKKNTKDYTYNNENRLTAIKENDKLLMAALYDGDNERLFVISDRGHCTLPCINDKNCNNIDKNEDGIDFDEELIMNTMLIPNGVDKTVELSNYDLTGYINNINSEYTQVLMEYAANNKITAVYEYGVFREGAEIDGKDYFYEYDGRGSVIGVANVNGKERAVYKYDAYGNTKTSGVAIANPYQYNAEYTDDATDLQYLRARYYRAETGSFITADTYRGEIENPLSLNRYTYTHNNPIMGKDPSGHFFLTACLIVAGIAAATTAVAYGVKKYSESKLKKTNEQIVSTTSEKNKIETTATSVQNSNSNKTSINGKSVNYKNKIYVFKTEAEAKNYFSLCDTLDKLNKDKVKYENTIKVSNVVQKVGLLTTGVALTVASGGTSSFVLAGAMSGAGIGIGSEVVMQTLTADGSIVDKLTSDVDYEDVLISAGTGAITGSISGGISSKVTAKGTDLALKIGKKLAPTSQVAQKAIGRGLTGFVSGGLSGGASNTINQVIDIATGESDSFSFKELAVQTATGASMGGFFGTIGGYKEGKAIEKNIADNRAMQANDPNKMNRKNAVGATPSKDSDVGQQVIERQLKNGTARYNDDGVLEYLDPSDNVWRVVGSDTHMGHIHGAAEWWSDGGYKFGAGSNEAKMFMNNPNNYRLEYGPNNISKGQVDKKIYGYFK